MANDEQYQLAKRSGEFISYAKPQKLNTKKRKLLKQCNGTTQRNGNSL